MPDTTRADLDAYLEHLRTARGLSPHTLRGYRTDLLTLMDATGGNLDAEHRAAWRTLLHDTRAASSAARALAAGKGFTRWLLHTGRLAADPLAGEIAPKIPAPLPRPLAAEDMRKLLDTAKPAERERRWRIFRNHAILELLYACGLRVAELCALDLADLAFDGVHGYSADRHGNLRVRHGKGDKDRLIPFNGHATAALEAWLSRRPRSGASASEQALFTSKRGTRLFPRNVFDVVKEAATASGLDPAAVHPHTFRASFATVLIEGGADLLTVSKLMGHSGLETLNSYVAVSMDRKNKIYAQCFKR